MLSVVNTITTPDVMLKDAWDSLNENISIFEKGNDVDMSAFDNKVRIFCDALAKLPPAEAKKYEGSLAQIIECLVNFTTKIELKKDGLEDKINSMNKRNIAYNAYGNALVLALQTAQSEE